MTHDRKAQVCHHPHLLCDCEQAQRLSRPTRLELTSAIDELYSAARDEREQAAALDSHAMSGAAAHTQHADHLERVGAWLEHVKAYRLGREPARPPGYSLADVAQRLRSTEMGAILADMMEGKEPPAVRAALERGCAAIACGQCGAALERVQGPNGNGLLCPSCDAEHLGELRELETRGRPSPATFVCTECSHVCIVDPDEPDENPDNTGRCAYCAGGICDHCGSGPDEQPDPSCPKKHKALQQQPAEGAELERLKHAAKMVGATFEHGDTMPAPALERDGGKP